MPRAHLTSCNGTAGENLTYTSKDGQYYEAGKRPSHGERNDLADVRELVRNPSSTLRDISDNGAVNFQGIRMAQIWLSYNEPERTTKPYVEWYWGPSGTGKSHKAHTENPGA